MFVLQTDARVFNDGFVFFSCIIKNHDKKVILTTIKKESISIELSVAEMLAIRWSLLLIQELKLERICIQSNALSVMDCINYIPYCFPRTHYLSSFKVASIMFLSRS